MAKKSKQKTWEEAQQLCRLSPDDITMAKRLGFVPDKLIRSRPSPKEGWKLPVKEWIHELYYRHFGEVLGESLRPPPPPFEPLSEEEARRFEEQLYWEDYHERNSEPAPRKKRAVGAPPPPVNVPSPPLENPIEKEYGWWESEFGSEIISDVTDDDVPF